MISASTLDKITHKSKHLLFEAAKKYRGQARSVVPYCERIVISDEYPDFIFLVHENMIFGGKGGLEDSSYDVYAFSKEGEYIKKEDAYELGKKFFVNMKEVKKI